MRPQVRTRFSEIGEPHFYDVEVPTPHGLAVIPFHYSESRDVFILEVSGEVIVQSPEAVTAAVQVAFRSVHELLTAPFSARSA